MKFSRSSGREAAPEDDRQDGDPCDPADHEAAIACHEHVQRASIGHPFQRSILQSESLVRGESRDHGGRG